MSTTRPRLQPLPPREKETSPYKTSKPVSRPAKAASSQSKSPPRRLQNIKTVGSSPSPAPPKGQKPNEKVANGVQKSRSAPLPPVPKGKEKVPPPVKKEKEGEKVQVSPLPPPPKEDEVQASPSLPPTSEQPSSPSPLPQEDNKIGLTPEAAATKIQATFKMHAEKKKFQETKIAGAIIPQGKQMGKGWYAAPPPKDNEVRVQKLRSYNVLDTPPEIAYDDIVKIAAAVCGTAMASISLIDDSRQWFKAQVGFTPSETPLEMSFCAHTIADVKGYMEVKDSHLDPRFMGNPLVNREFGVRYYAGSALVTPDNQAVGTLCVLDTKTHALTEQQLETLRALSRLVVNQLEARYQNIQLIDLHNKLQYSQEKLKEANEALTAQNNALRKQLKELKQDELEINAPVAKVVDLLSTIHGQIQDKHQQVLLKDAIKMIATHKLYEVDMEEVIAHRANVDDQTKGFLLTQLDSPTAPKDPVYGSTNDDVIAVASPDIALSESPKKGEESGAEKKIRKEVSFSLVPKVSLDGNEEDSKIGAVVEGVKGLVTHLHEWDFDVFALADTCKKPLFYSTLTLLHKYELLKKIPLSAAKLVHFLSEVESGYIQANPYHNNIHAADVTLGSNYVVETSGLLKYMTPTEHLALIIAATVHDLGHLGVNNTFLIQTAHEIAISHNDKSVMENYHCAQAFRLLYNSENNFLEGLSLAERQELRKMMIELVLATDMSQHVDIFNAFQNKRAAAGGLDVANNKQDRLLVMKMAIKCADISNSAKPRKLYLNWADRVMEEFWAQGDQERKLGLPVSAFMDRTQPDVTKCQVGFIQFIALPFYSAMVEQFPVLSKCTDTMKENLEYWKTKV